MRTQPQFQKSLASQQVIDLSWKNLNVFTRNVQKKKKNVGDLQEPLQANRSYSQILTNQSGYIKNGEIQAIMGPSGAGKTTLLRCITQKLQPTLTKIVEGRPLANGKVYSSNDFSSFGVFVMQDDLLFATLTVKETLLFSARMKLRGPEKNKESVVDRIIEDLQLQHCQNSYIGSTIIKGISGGERKRTCIGVELVTDPIVVILDEPTSGLDSFTAFKVISIIKDLAQREKKSIIFTIHQPSYDIFKLIDKLLLMQDGKMIYSGSNIITYMEKLQVQIPKFSNICDFFMQEITSNKDNTTLNNASFETQLRSQIDHNIDENQTNDGFLRRQVKNSFCYQFKVIIDRSYKNYIRDPSLLKARLFLVSIEQ